VNDFALVNSGQTPLFVGEIRLRYTNGVVVVPPQTQTHHVGCASENNKWKECYMGQNVIKVQLYQQYSNSPCIQGKTWAPDYNKHIIAVTDGCRADFLVTTKN